MEFYRKLYTFWNLSFRIKKLFFKAVFVSAIVKFTLVFLPFKIVLKWLGKKNIESPKDIHPDSEFIRSEIKRALALCDRHTFWKTECYTLALTGKIILKIYNISSTLYIGFCKNEKGIFEGHAWLRSYDTILVGGIESDKFKVQSFFT